MPNPDIPEATELAKTQPPKVDLSLPGQTAPSGNLIYPYVKDQGRLADYNYFARLFMGDHFTAFNMKIDDERWTNVYRKLRYVKVNFAGLLSKILADMLFSEPIQVKVPDGDQDFIDGLWFDNKMDTQCYESALSNSALGDALFKIRVGKRKPTDEESSVIIEDITPHIYFPDLDPFNVRGEPRKHELSWTFKSGAEIYLRKEIHTPGFITNEVYLMKGNEIAEKKPVSILGIPGMVDTQETGIDESLIVHIPNWKFGNRYFGLSDYYDLDALFYAINNRMTSIDNILDKHSDPILMVPPGVLDEKGNVKKKSLGVIEYEEGESGKPEYIVWDASLENAFKEIEKLVEFFYLSAEISPDILGLGEGVSDSGRALKFKLMRTIAKAARKKLYYDQGIKQLMYIAQKVAKEHNIKVNGKTLNGEPVIPEIDWADGLPIDQKEQLENETAAIDAGLTSKKAAIMRIYQVDEDTAEEMLKEIKEEDAVGMPDAHVSDNGMGKGDTGMGGGDGMKGDTGMSMIKNGQSSMPPGGKM